MKRWKLILVLLLGFAVAAALVGRWAWQEVVGPGTRFQEESRVALIPSGATFDAVIDSLRAVQAISDEQRFRWLAGRKNYPDRIRPGRYRIPQGMSMNALLNMLRAGEQEPVRVTFSNVDHLPELAGRLAQVLEPDSVAFMEAFLDASLQQEVRLNEATMISLFIPNTYEFWWTTSPKQFIVRMRKEHEAFWTTARLERAEELGMSPVEVATLASIVQAETVRSDDAKRIAGVYLNRLRIGMPLQADPTLKFAGKLKGAMRILEADKLVDSPYNTYRNKGLPPGPINMSEARFLDAVLQAEKHDYLYFCARSDLSGFSDFARTYEQHQVNARKYHRALNERGIFR